MFSYSQVLWTFLSTSSLFEETLGVWLSKFLCIWKLMIFSNIYIYIYIYIYGLDYNRSINVDTSHCEMEIDRRSVSFRHFQWNDNQNDMIKDNNNVPVSKAICVWLLTQTTEAKMKVVDHWQAYCGIRLLKPDWLPQELSMHFDEINYIFTDFYWTLNPVLLLRKN